MLGFISPRIVDQRAYHGNQAVWSSPIVHPGKWSSVARWYEFLNLKIELLLKGDPSGDAAKCPANNFWLL